MAGVGVGLSLENPKRKREPKTLKEAVPNEYTRQVLAGKGVTTLAQLKSHMDFDLVTVSPKLTDFVGLGYAESLGTINAEGQDIAKVGDLSGMAALWNFNLTNNELVTVRGVRTLSGLQFLHVGFNQMTAIDLSGGHLTTLFRLDLNDNQFDQAAMESIIDDLWVMRASFGSNGSVINLQNNPGSAAAETSKASEIADLRNAGASVTI